MVEDIFIRVTQVTDKGEKLNNFLNISSVERFSDESPEFLYKGALTLAYLKSKEATKTGLDDLVLHLSTPMEKIEERLIQAKRLVQI